MSKKLWKTTVIIFSEFDPHSYDLTDLAFEATSGLAYSPYQNKEFVDVEFDEHWDGCDFFNDMEDDNV